MEWHQQHSKNAAYTLIDASTPRPVCTACTYGTMQQTSTDHRRQHRPNPTVPGQQFVLDAFTNIHLSSRHHKHCDLFTDLATGQTFPVFTKDRSAAELVSKATIFFQSHPAWQTSHPNTTRFIRIDPESNYNSKAFLKCLSDFKYEIERTPPRDKHANGIAERAVGLITAKTNMAMLAPNPPVPNKFWDLAMAYACRTQSFNPNKRLNDSPYHYVHGEHIDIKDLHPFWARCYVHIPLKYRKGKLNSPRAYKAHFVGYNFSTILFPNYLVIEVYKNGTYGEVRSSKDVIFDSSINFRDTTAFPPEEAFPQYIPPLESPPSPAATALATSTPPDPAHPVPSSSSDSAPDHTPPIRRVRQQPAIKENIDPDAVYWYSTFVDTHEYPLKMVELTHYNLSVKIKDPDVPKNFWDAMRQPDWEAAINKERGKFELNNCLKEVPYTGQHLVPMMWLFNIKTDGTKKARLVGRGDMMIPWVDYDPNAVYCGNVAASSCWIFRDLE